MLLSGKQQLRCVLALPRGIEGGRYKALFSLTNSNHPPQP
jgi:hypothetical protein